MKIEKFDILVFIPGLWNVCHLVIQHISIRRELNGHVWLEAAVLLKPTSLIGLLPSALLTGPGQWAGFVPQDLCTACSLCPTPPPGVYHPDNLINALFTPLLLTWPTHLNWNHHTSHCDTPNSFYLPQVSPLSTYDLLKDHIFIMHSLFFLMRQAPQGQVPILFRDVFPAFMTLSGTEQSLNKYFLSEWTNKNLNLSSHEGVQVRACSQRLTESNSHGDLGAVEMGAIFICWQSLQEKARLGSMPQAFSESPLCGGLWGAVMQWSQYGHGSLSFRPGLPQAAPEPRASAKGWGDW